MNEFKLAYESAVIQWHQDPARQERSMEIEVAIANARLNGGFVVVTSAPAYCPYTDAIMGEDRFLEGVYDEYGDAVDACDEVHDSSLGEYSTRIYPEPEYDPPEPVIYDAIANGECPF